jgi:hypothetical protein
MKADHFSGSTNPGARRHLYRSIHKILLTVVLLVLGTGTVTAADFQLDSGDSFGLGAGTLDLGCGNFTLHSGAVFNAGSGNIQLSGNWSNQGSFSRGSSSVVFDDSCGAASTSHVTGVTHFHDLAATTTTAHELRLESGQTHTIASALELTGTQNELLKISSSAPGTPAYFVLEEGGSQTISYVDVQDNYASPPGQWLAPDTPEHFNSVDSGGNLRWFLTGMEPIEPIPTLSGLGLVLLLLLLSAVYLQRTGRMMCS